MTKKLKKKRRKKKIDNNFLKNNRKSILFNLDKNNINKNYRNSSK